MKVAVSQRFGAPLVIEHVALDPPWPGQVRVRCREALRNVISF